MSLLSKTTKEKINENHVDITKLPKCRLLEFLDRQNIILANKSALTKLPDKGKKIINFKNDIENEIKKRDEADDINLAMAGLSLNADIQEMEWTGKLGQNNTTELNDDDPFKILVTHSGTNFHQKIIKTEEEEEEKLITEQDLEDAYSINICNKLHHVVQPVKFLPNRTLNKEQILSHKKRDISSAVVPESKYGSSKQVPLEESLKIQIEQSRHLKEVQLKHAAERLKDKSYIVGQKMPDINNIREYREVELISEELLDDEEKDLDE